MALTFPKAGKPKPAAKKIDGSSKAKAPVTKKTKTKKLKPQSKKEGREEVGEGYLSQKAPKS